jgi:parallel beta-helix repeat protein
LGSNHNNVAGNSIANSKCGICLNQSLNNVIYHNNFINNTIQANPTSTVAHIWDDGYPSGGNYWSDYNGTDSDHDGIGDTPYFINAGNQDNYPLMGTFSDHSVNWANATYHVNTICNSTIADFFFGVLAVYPDHVPGPPWTTSMIFNVTGDAPGFCRIMIPKEVLDGEYVVTLDGFTMSPSMWRELPTSNDTTLYLYLTYPFGFHRIWIMGTTMIPEFPSFLILPLLMIATLLAAIAYKRKQALTTSEG